MTSSTNLEELAGLVERCRRYGHQEIADTLDSLSAEVRRLTDNLTPSAETKADYMGEFSVPWPVVGEDGNDHIISINVPWTTIKEIMAAIVARKALGSEGG